MDLRVAMTFDSLMDLVREDVMAKKRMLNSYSIYILSSGIIANENRALSDICYLDDDPTVTDDNEEIYSEFVTQNDLEIFSLGQHLVDTTSNALMQKADATNAELLEAFEWYLRMDGFIDFFADKSTPEFFASILPNISIEELKVFIDDFNTTRLKGYRLIPAQCGIMLYSNSNRCDVSTLSGCFAITHHSFALRIIISGGHWSHLLYGEHQLASPAWCNVSGQERKKKPKMQIMPVPQAIQDVFPHTDVNVIRNYICEEKNVATLVEKNEKLYVRVEDKYPIDTPRQGFDFIRYLGFNISM